MPANVIVAIWSNSNTDTNSWSTTTASRIMRLNNRLQVVNQWITKYTAELNPSMSFKAVFLAPEYYFTRQSPTNERQPMGDDDRLKLETSLLGLSRMFPQILIVPGTLFYAKPLMRSALGASANKFDPATGTRSLPKTTKPDRRGRSVQHVRRYIANVPAQRDANDFDFRTWVGGGYGAGANPVPSLSEIKIALRDRTKAPWIVKNAAYLLLGGKRIAKFDKQSDFGEALGASPDDAAFLPGVFKQCPEIGGYRFGTEVCFDHGNAVLARRHVTPMHFHLVVSDWVHTSVGNMAMSNGGCYVHASTNYDESSIWIRTPTGATQNISTDHTYWKESMGAPGSMLDGYVVPLPPPIVPQRA